MSANKPVINALQSELGSQYKEANKGEVLFRCPFCHHHKLKLSVNLDPQKSEFGYYKCWVCKESGKTLWTLLKKKGASPSTFSRVEHALKSVGVYRSRFFTGDENAVDEDSDNNQTLTLPDEFKPIWEPSDTLSYRYAVNYLKKRGIGLGEVIKYQLGRCESGRYANRIIIPSYDEDDTLNYFTGRDYYNGSWVKYLNPKTSRNIVPFENVISWTAPVILTEGPIDAIRTKRNALPLFGKSLSDKLKQKLFKYKPPQVYIALDNDAFSHAVRMAEWLMNEGMNVYLVQLDEEDPGDLGFENMMHRVHETSELSFKSLVRHKLA